MLRHENPAVQLWALYHDAHELLTGDVPREMKSIELQEEQASLDDILIARLGVGHRDVVSPVMQADVICGAAEHTHWERVIYQSRCWGEPVAAFVGKAGLLMDAVEGVRVRSRITA